MFCAIQFHCHIVFHSLNLPLYSTAMGNWIISSILLLWILLARNILVYIFLGEEKYTHISKREYGWVTRYTYLPLYQIMLNTFFKAVAVIHHLNSCDYYSSYSSSYCPTEQFSARESHGWIFFSASERPPWPRENTRKWTWLKNMKDGIFQLEKSRSDS